MVDGVLCTLGMRVLVKDQKLPYQNGIYVLNKERDWTRSTDFDTAGKVRMGSWIWVKDGKDQHNTVWSIYLPQECPNDKDFPDMLFRAASEDLLERSDAPGQHVVWSLEHNRPVWCQEAAEDPVTAEVLKGRERYQIRPPLEDGEYWLKVGDATGWCMNQVMVHTDGQMAWDRGLVIEHGKNPPKIRLFSDYIQVHVKDHARQMEARWKRTYESI